MVAVNGVLPGSDVETALVAWSTPERRGHASDHLKGGPMPGPSEVDVKGIFNRLAIPGWRDSGQTLSGGGQAAVLVVVDTNNRKGVFRYLRSDDPTDIRRFNRELRVLTDLKFEHPSIIKILDHTRDDRSRWYISELGPIPFNGA
jgi:hypothetical protein